MSVIEIIAVVFSILYVTLAAKENIWCWLCAAVSVSLYIYICYSAKLYLETGLQGFYFIMAFYGYWQWNRPKKEITISTWSLQRHLLIFGVGIIASLLLGKLFEIYTDAALPTIDSFTTIFSLFATYMVTKKILENWIYWIVIDIVSVFLYFSRDLQLTAGLFAAYTIIAVFGYLSWKKQLNTLS